jgi:ABC-type glycerol-3-phosphate transport system substrate-binding protein
MHFFTETLKLYTQYNAVQGALSQVDKTIAASTGSFYKAQALFLPGMDADASGFAKQVVALGNGSKINAAVFPKGLERHTTFNSWGWAIGATSKNVEAVWQVIKGLTLDRKFIGQNALLANRLPAYRAAIPEAVSHLIDAAPIDWKVIVDALSIPDVARPYPWYFNKNGQQANALINSVLTSITSGKKAPKQALEENHDALDVIMREGAW